MRRISAAELTIRPFHLLDQRWALLVAGRERPNPMTVSWGGFGTLWHLPVVTLYVRHSRHTYSLLVEHPEFTLNFLPERYRETLRFCGTRSGRDVDKWETTGLTREPSESVDVPWIAESDLALECRTLARVDIGTDSLPEKIRHEFYVEDDDNLHEAFIAHVLNVWEAD
jgi:flavin reductase (DIM6/NTAB) family NADH-FMN oxidoreductase RutF